MKKIGWMTISAVSLVAERNEELSLVEVIWDLECYAFMVESWQREMRITKLNEARSLIPKGSSTSSWKTNFSSRTFRLLEIFKSELLIQKLLRFMEQTWTKFQDQNERTKSPTQISLS